MFSKIFADFCACVLTQKTLQHLVFLFFIFLTHFLDELAKVFFAFYLFPWTHLKITVYRLLISFKNRCGQLKHKQTLKHAHKMQTAMYRPNEKSEEWR